MDQNTIKNPTSLRMTLKLTMPNIAQSFMPNNSQSDNNCCRFANLFGVAFSTVFCAICDLVVALF